MLLLSISVLPLVVASVALWGSTPPTARADNADDYVLTEVSVTGVSSTPTFSYEATQATSVPPTQAFTIRYQDPCGPDCSQSVDVSMQIQVPARLSRGARYTVSATAHETLTRTVDWIISPGRVFLHLCGDTIIWDYRCRVIEEKDIPVEKSTVSRDLVLPATELLATSSNTSGESFSFRAGAYFGEGILAPGAEVVVNLTYHMCTSERGCNTVQGQVRTESPAFPLNGVEVSILQDGKVIGRGTTQAPSGRYTIPNVPVATAARIRVSLQNQEGVPPPFRVLYGGAAGPLAESLTQPLDIASGPPVERDVVLGDRPDMDSVPNVPRNKINDLGVIYYHTRQAWQLTTQVGQRLDFQLPVDIRAFSSTDGVFWRGPRTDGANAGVDPYISIAEAASSAADTNRPSNREWHEFGHHVMADTFGNLMPAVSGDANHGGYSNLSSNDSWAEGFAEFYSLMVGREIAASARPELYHWDGRDDSLEANSVAWNDEEFALAGLLWDLYDPPDADDGSIMYYDGRGVRYADCIQTGFNDLWSLFRALWDREVPRPPAAPADFPYVFDVKMLYDVLKRQSVGATHSRGGALSDLDELFVAHGFFVDANGNHKYDAGEEIGRAAYPSRPGRRARPPKPGSYVAFDARSVQTGSPVDVHTFTIDVRFAAPFEHYSYSFEQDSTLTPGRLYFGGPDPQYAATTYITAKGEGTESRTPLTLTNDAYWTAMSQNHTDFFTQHTFEMVPRSRTFLPLVMRDATTSSTHPSSSMQLLAAGAHVPRACTPDSGSPTPTPTSTPSASPTVIVPPGTATPTQTATASTTVVGPTPTRTPTPIPAATRTATPTATRTPSTQAVTVEQVWTTGSDDVQRMGFAPGETVKLWIKVTNTGSVATTAQLTWDVFSQWGVRQDSLSGTDSRSVPPGTSSFVLQRTVPDVWPDTYSFVGSATAAGQMSTRPADLFLTSGLRVADDFSNPASGWSTDDSAEYTVSYAGGEYRILVKNAGRAIRVAGPGTRMAEDFVVEADVRPVTSTTDHFGLMLGESDDNTHFDAFSIYRDGSYRVSQYDGSWQDLVARTASPAVRSGQSTNHLTAIVRGTTISVYANGVWLADTIDALFPTGAEQGLIDSSPGANAEARFDNFRLYGLGGGTPLRPAAPGAPGPWQERNNQPVGVGSVEGR